MLTGTPSGVLLSSLLVGALVYVSVLAARFLLDLRRRKAFLKDFPSLPCHWLFGHVVDFPGPNEVGLTWLKARCNLSTEGMGLTWYGPVVPVVATFGPSTVKAILKTSEPKPRQFGGYVNIYRWLGDGLLLSGGPKWARNRRLLTPAFHFDILRPYMAINNRAADTLISKLEGFADKNEFFEVTNHISLLTLDIILLCAFSYTNDCQLKGDSHPYVQAIHRLGEAVVYRMLRPWLYPAFLFNLSPTGRQFNRDCDFVHGISEEIIAKRKLTLAAQGPEILSKSRYLDFLDILLTAKDESGQGLSELEIRDEVDTFLFEGHDTTASGISWTLYSLAAHPEHQRRCQQEVDEILRDRDSKDIEWDDLPRLTHLTLCIKEALRMHTPVPFIQRQTTKDLEVEGRRIPAGTIVDIHLYVLHHNEKVWEDPEEFHPERFTPENIAALDNYAFVPFSAGPRNCIGQHFAMHEMKSVVAKILSRFTLTLDPARPVEHRITVVMKTENGMYMKATRREPDEY